MSILPKKFCNMHIALRNMHIAIESILPLTYGMVEKERAPPPKNVERVIYE
jgi:hypothetical protein